MPQGIEFFGENVASQDKANAIIGRLYETAQPEAAFSKPVTQGEYTVITAAEVSVGMGLGYGGGGASQPAEEGKQAEQGFGSGGGGGGISSARPVAVIEIGPDGVIVEPIVDVTKIALAFFTAIGSMALMFSKMKKSNS